MIEVCITYPTEFIKTYMQISKQDSTQGYRKTVSHIYKDYGVRGFYRGLQVMLVFSTPKTVARFGTYQ